MSVRHLSLTARMSLMFMSVVVVVLTMAGLSFNVLSQHHFEVLDRQALVEKLESTRHILNNARSDASLTEELPQLRALLGAHHDLAATILSGDGRVLFSDPKAADVPESFRHAEEQSMWEWQNAGHLYRGMTAQISVADKSEPLTTLLILDVTSHAHFFETLQRWFIAGLVISALISAALGWVVVRSGLRPLRQVTHLATSMSARSLQERIPLEPVPLELQQLVLSFNAMLGRLEDAFVRLSNFSADIAHELRTPVSNLMTHTEVVLTRKRDLDAYEDNLYSNLEELKPDFAYQIPDAEALPIVFDLLEHEGLCMGGSTGINIAGAIRMARDMGPGHTIVTILCDYGTRYQSKLFNPDFLRDKGLPVPGWLDRPARELPDMRAES